MTRNGITMTRTSQIVAVICAFIPLFSTIGGCGTLGDVREARGTGAVRLFDHPFEAVWAAVPDAMIDVDLAVARENRAEGYFLGRRGMTAFSWGENVAVFVDSKGAQLTQVEVASKARVSVNITATNFERKILDAIGKRLE